MPDVRVWLCKQEIPMKATMMAKALRVLAASAILTSVVVVGARAQQGKALRQFMRQKLDHSQRVLEGLTREDYALIEKNAKALREVSEDAQWRVSPNINYLR